MRSEDDRKRTISPDPETEEKIREKIKSKGKMTYNSETGLSIPHLTYEEAESFMPEKALDILRSYHSGKYYIFKEKDIEEMKPQLRKLLHKKVGVADIEWWEGCGTAYRTSDYKDEDAVLAKIFETSVEKELTKGAKIKYKKEPQADVSRYNEYGQIVSKYASYDTQIPTRSGGFGRFAGPYHIYDDKTMEDVKLWEWGVDYDVG